MGWKGCILSGGQRNGGLTGGHAGGLRMGAGPHYADKKKSNFPNILYKGLEQLQSHTVHI